MPFTIEITDDVDPTALATVALAILTLAALWFTRRALKQTPEEIDLSRQEVEEGQRPVLVPVLDNTRRITLPDGETGPATPTAPGNRIFVPVENIGSGRALGVEMGITYRVDSIPEEYRGEHTMVSPGIGIGHLASLELPFVSAPRGPFDLRLSYRDVAGKEWVTTARFEIGMADRYEDVVIVASATNRNSRTSVRMRWQRLREGWTSRSR